MYEFNLNNISLSTELHICRKYMITNFFITDNFNLF